MNNPTTPGIYLCVWKSHCVTRDEVRCQDEYFNWFDGTEWHWGYKDKDQAARIKHDPIGADLGTGRGQIELVYWEAA